MPQFRVSQPALTAQRASTVTLLQVTGLRLALLVPTLMLDSTSALHAQLAWTVLVKRSRL